MTLEVLALTDYLFDAVLNIYSIIEKSGTRLFSVCWIVSVQFNWNNTCSYDPHSQGFGT